MPLLYYQDEARNGARRYTSPIRRFNPSKPYNKAHSVKHRHGAKYKRVSIDNHNKTWYIEK